MLKRIGVGFCLLIAAPLAPHSARAQAPARVEFVSAIDDVMMLKAFVNLAADSMQGRRIATPGSDKARAYLIGELKRLGVEPLVKGYTSTFVGRAVTGMETVEFSGARRMRPGIGSETSVSQRTIATASVTGTNLLGVVRGTVNPQRYIVVSAHYDHVGLFDGRLHPGANDNASGAAALLAIADLVTAAPPKNSIIFAWFDGEESGLLGSAAFLRTPPVPLKQIVANVNADMISRSDNGVLYVVGELLHPAIKPLIDSVTASGLLKVRAGHDGRDELEDLTKRSDQWSFHQKRIPFAFFTADENADYHRPTDVAVKADVGFYVRAVTVIADFVRRLDETYDQLFPVRR